MVEALFPRPPAPGRHEDAAVDGLSGDLGKEALDEVQLGNERYRQGLLPSH